MFLAAGPPSDPVPQPGRTRRRQPLLLAALAILASCTSATNTTSTRNDQIAPDEPVFAALTMVPCNGATNLIASGVVIGADEILTVAHPFVPVGGDTSAATAAGVREIEVEVGDLITSASLVAVDAERDLALLHVSTAFDHPARLGVGSDGVVVTVDTRRGPLAALVVDRRRATLEGVGPRAALRLDVGVQAGDSGAPVMDENGEVVGLIFAAIRPAPGATSTGSWAVAAEELDDFITHRKTYEVPTQQCE